MESNVSTFSLIASKTVVVINKVFLYTKVKGEYIHLSSITCMVLFFKNLYALSIWSLLTGMTGNMSLILSFSKWLTVPASRIKRYMFTPMIRNATLLSSMPLH